VGALGLGAYLELKSRREERWLAERYPGYEAYRRRTRWKFVPGLR
jgi:protein-S-isoprenylcysteine O-methyltransferase Ste14